MVRQESAVRSVPQSGLKLVPERNTRGEGAASLKQIAKIAKIDFQAWTRDPGMGPNELLPSNETLLNAAVPARLAYSIMLKTREQLIEMHGKIEHQQVDEMMAAFAAAGEKLKAIAYMVEGAYARVLASAAPHNQRKGKFKGVHDMRYKNRRARMAS